MMTMMTMMTMMMMMMMTTKRTGAIRVAMPKNGTVHMPAHLPTLAAKNGSEHRTQTFPSDKQATPSPRTASIYPQELREDKPGLQKCPNCHVYFGYAICVDLGALRVRTRGYDLLWA